jgi:hypothetical protein
MIIVQQRQPLSETKESGFARRLRHIEIMLVLPHSDLNGVKPRHQSPDKRGGARPNRRQSGYSPFEKAPGRVLCRIHFVPLRAAGRNAMKFYLPADEEVFEALLIAPTPVTIIGQASATVF